VIPPGAEPGRGEAVDEVARRPLRSDSPGRAALHLGRGEGDDVGGEDGCAGWSDAGPDRRARGGHEEDPDEEHEAPRHVRYSTVWGDGTFNVSGSKWNHNATAGPWRRRVIVSPRPGGEGSDEPPSADPRDACDARTA